MSSTTGYVFTLGGTAVSWSSKLQKIVALSTAKAEYVAVTEASKKMVWLQNFLSELGRENKVNTFYSDSQSAIYLAKNPAFHSRTNHIELRYHYIHSLLERNILRLEKIRGSEKYCRYVHQGWKLCSASTGLTTERDEAWHYQLP